MKLKQGTYSSALMLLAVVSACIVLAPKPAQTAEQSRITGSLNGGQTVVLAGNVSPKAKKLYDQGRVEPTLKINYMTLQTMPSASQQAALKKFLADVQDKSSPNYHKWLTPEQRADQFGLSQGDMDKITSWLKSQGFTIDKTARGRDYVAFSGTAAQVASTFKTEIHYYLVDGKTHFANATPPSVPLALSGIVVGIRNLNDFHPPAPKHNASKPKAMPFLSNGCVGAGCQFIAPGDLETIYDLTPLYTLGFNGTGESIAVVGQTDIVASDISDYQTLFNLPVVPTTIMLSGPDPCGGVITNCNAGDQLESDLDLEVAQAVAQNATIIYATSLDVFTSAQNVIDGNLAPVLSMSYGGCEAEDQTSLASLEMMAQMGNTQGITWVNSSGDSGAAGCDPDTETEAMLGLAVNIPASIPEVTGVGGTEFNEGGNYALYWSPNNGATGGSALSYIPEIAWNDTAIQGTLTATGGGVSSCFTVNSSNMCDGGFPLPKWQTGLSGIQGTFRNVPDVSLSAGVANDPYFICAQIACENQGFFSVGGTSASAPAFAGMVVLLNQYLVTNGFQTTPGVGNINPTLYSVALSTPLAFHDITTGNNIVPCASGSPNCVNGQLGYSAGTGYDPVTGLGSVDADVLITNYAGVPVGTPTTTSLTAVPNNITTGTSVTLTATVTGSGGTPTGTVTFLNGTTSLGTGTLSAGVATLLTSTLPIGTDSITASYGGDSTFASSISAPVIVTVTGVPTTTALTASPTTIAQGANVTLTATVTGSGGTPTGTVTFLNGTTSLGTGTLSGGVATLMTATLPVGSDSITASYGGDATFGNSVSAPVIVTVTGTTSSPAALIVSQGGTTSSTITASGFTSTVTFSCTGAPSEAMCTLNPASVSPTNGVAISTLTVSTTAPSALFVGNRRILPPGPQAPVLFLIVGLMGLMGLTTAWKHLASPSRLRWVAMPALIVLGLVGMASCGGGGGGGNAGTPVGSYTIVVTATGGGVTQTVNVPLSVNSTSIRVR